MANELPEDAESNEFLYLHKTDPVEIFTEELTLIKSPTFIKNEDADNRVAAILRAAGMSTYGDVLEYAAKHFFSDLPGVDAHMAERIHKQIESAESVNKTQAVQKLFHTQRALGQLAKLSQELVAQAIGKGQTIDSSM